MNYVAVGAVCFIGGLAVGLLRKIYKVVVECCNLLDWEDYT